MLAIKGARRMGGEPPQVLLLLEQLLHAPRPPYICMLHPPGSVPAAFVNLRSLLRGHLDSHFAMFSWGQSGHSYKFVVF